MKKVLCFFVAFSFVANRASASQLLQAQTNIESIYKSISQSHGQFKNEELRNSLLLSAVCLRHKFGRNQALAVLNEAFQKVFKTAHQIQSYKNFIGSHAIFWQMPSKQKLNSICGVVLK